MTAHVNKYHLLANNASFYSKKAPPHKNLDSYKGDNADNAENARQNSVYVHHFSKISDEDFERCCMVQNGHQFQNPYRHDGRQYERKPKQYSSYQFEKFRTRESISSRSEISNRNAPPATQQKAVPGNKMKKSKLFHLEHKAAIDKLEESYWAKWKPNKSPPSTKLKDLPEEFQEGAATKPPKAAARVKTKPDNVEERGDSSETIMSHYQTRHTSTEETPSSHQTIAETQIKEEPLDDLPPLVLNEPKTESSRELRNLETIPTAITPHLPAKQDVSVMEDDVKPLKHTDSYVLLSKKQTGEERPHFQQPKCIKLFKNVTNGNYVKGGTYTLKSCLKKEKPAPKSNIQLGKPGSPMKITIKGKHK